MTVVYQLKGIEFEWDGRKAITNVTKHGITFQMACELFFDPFLYPLEDELVDGELRDAVIGMTTKWKLLFVVYTLRGDVIRIISARYAENPERKVYENR